MNKVTVILGSARSDGNTAALVERLIANLREQTNVFDLANLAFEPFEYQLYGDRDDFRSVVDTMLKSQHIVFATPVYWYAMSATLKAFF